AALALLDFITGTDAGAIFARWQDNVPCLRAAADTLAQSQSPRGLEQVIQSIGQSREAWLPHGYSFTSAYARMIDTEIIDSLNGQYNTSETVKRIRTKAKQFISAYGIDVKQQ